MLQQTRVDTVIPYYKRFVAKFPTLETLAKAPEDGVMAAWSGLGYYRRARLLHQGAREALERYGGEMPRDPDARRALSGIGRYTAGAIGSIAFDRPEPIVDGNVARVLCRVFAIESPLGKAVTEKQLWQRAEELVQGPRPGDFNQALMELGATVCTKHSPQCSRCPVAPHCRALQRGLVDRLPMPRTRRPPVAQAIDAVVATAGNDRLWLIRQDGALFGGLWNVPMIERAAGEPPSATRALQAAGIRTELVPQAVGEVTHVLSHRKLQVTIYRAEAKRAEPSPTRRLVRLRETTDLGLSRLTHRILNRARLDPPVND